MFALKRTSLGSRLVCATLLNTSLAELRLEEVWNTGAILAPERLERVPSTTRVAETLFSLN